MNLLIILLLASNIQAALPKSTMIPYIIDFKFGGMNRCWYFEVSGPGGLENLENLVKWDGRPIPKPTEGDIISWKKEYDISKKGKARYEKRIGRK